MNYSPLDAEMSERGVPNVPPAHDLPSALAPAAAFYCPSGFELTFFCRATATFRALTGQRSIRSIKEINTPELSYGRGLSADH